MLPRSTLMMFSVDIIIEVWRDLVLDPRHVGRQVDVVHGRKGLSAPRGSSSKTSRPAPAMRFSFSASHRATGIHDPAPGGVDQVGGGLHQGQALGVDQVAGARHSAGMEAHVVALAKQLLQGHIGDLMLARRTPHR